MITAITGIIIARARRQFGVCGRTRPSRRPASRRAIPRASRSSSSAATPWSVGGSRRSLSDLKFAECVSQVWTRPMLTWTIGTPASTSRRGQQQRLSIHVPAVAIPPPGIFAAQVECPGDFAREQEAIRPLELRGQRIFESGRSARRSGRGPWSAPRAAICGDRAARH